MLDHASQRIREAVRLTAAALVDAEKRERGMRAEIRVLREQICLAEKRGWVLPAPSVPLTRRECDVLRLVACGYSNPQIARQLAIARPTVVRHTNAIFTKLGVIDRTNAALYAWRHGVIGLDEAWEAMIALQWGGRPDGS